MYYLIKKEDKYNIVNAKCKSWQRWTKFSGGYLYDYYCIDEDENKPGFSTENIKAKAKTRKFLQKKYAEKLI